MKRAAVPSILVVVVLVSLVQLSRLWGGGLAVMNTLSVSGWIDDSPEIYIVASYIVSDLPSYRRKRNAPREIIFDNSIFGRQFGRRKTGHRI
jgi:hypothetical protein